jgi:hypothetical protein
VAKKERYVIRTLDQVSACGDNWDKGKLGSSVVLDDSRSLDLCVGLRFHPSFLPRMLMLNPKVFVPCVELEIFQQKQRVMQEKAAVAQAALAFDQELLEADEGAGSSDSGSDADDEEDVERDLANISVLQSANQANQASHSVSAKRPSSTLLPPDQRNACPTQR